MARPYEGGNAMAKLIRSAAAGTEDSADVRVTVAPAETLRLTLHSTLHAQFGAAIEQTVRQVLTEQEIDCADVLVEDKGALDWILRARLETALGRAREDAQ